MRHQNELAALSNPALALLTFILIVVTAFYARANWRVMRLMEADLRFKIEPVPSINIDPITDGHMHVRGINVRIKVLNAPLRLICVTVFTDPSKKDLKDRHFNLDRYPVPIGDVFTVEHFFLTTLTPESRWYVIVEYDDLPGIKRYVKTITGRGTNTDEHSGKVMKARF